LFNDLIWDWNQLSHWAGSWNHLKSCNITRVIR
jgi:hypothetical protein